MGLSRAENRVMRTDDHEVEAFYSGGPGIPYYQPVLACSCGFSTERELTWAEAGAAYDEHLAETSDGPL